MSDGAGKDRYADVCRMALQIRWGDMDAAGHVNNTIYFRFMEQVRLTWFERLGLLGDIGIGQGPVIVNAAMTFLNQLRYPGDAIATMSVANPGRSSFDTAFHLMRADDPDTVYARGSARCVWIDYGTNKSAPMPDSLRSAILDPRLISIGVDQPQA